MTSLNKWKTLNSQLVLNNKWCRVKQDTVKLSNGTIIDDYFINIRPDIALVFPVTKNKQVIFVRQYRHGVEEILLELPAGSFDADREDSLSAARRELEEETGYISEKLIQLPALYDNPVKDTNKIYLFLALDATPIGKQNFDITEDIEIELIPLIEIKERIFTGEICVSGSVSALFLGLDYLSQLDYNQK